MYMDLRKELDLILKEYGRKVVVLHCDRRIKCPKCWSATYDEPLADCPRCLGTGHPWIVKVHKAWGTPSLGLSGSYPPEPEPAPYLSDVMHFFFKHNVVVDACDYILELENNRVMTVYKVLRRPIFFGLGGRREYIRTSTVQKPEELTRMQRWWAKEAVHYV